MLHHGSVGCEFRIKYKKLNPNGNHQPQLPSIVFHNKIYIFIMIFTALSFLRLIYGFFLIWGGNVNFMVLKRKSMS